MDWRSRALIAAFVLGAGCSGKTTRDGAGSSGGANLPSTGGTGGEDPRGAAGSGEGGTGGMMGDGGTGGAIASGGDPSTGGGVTAGTAGSGTGTAASGTGATGGYVSGGTGSVIGTGAVAGGTGGGIETGGIIETGGVTGGIVETGGHATGATGGVESTGGTGGNADGTGGTVSPRCGNPVTWLETETSDLFANIATDDNRYRFQSAGWNMNGGEHTVSLLRSCGFAVNEQTCSSTDSPCSFPAVYAGTDDEGHRTNGFTPMQISSITSIPTCLNWRSGSAGSEDEYTVMIDVRFNTTSEATSGAELLRIWFREPPLNQPPGDFPEADGVLIGNQTWTFWAGVNEHSHYVVTYVAPGDLAEGMAYEFNLRDFIDDAVERGYIKTHLYLISIMGGLQIWSGAQGASVTEFRTEVR